ncbi:hypothetical protein H5410_021613 [Solanum commersonii]|uniref:Uncharacterized protein n=1 Tax=Solanum commersonii TaxID=4109 RepID=A0A9J5ZFT0_SOLCO|nr:hypothetical protein H5410_021613 [Solanum commersonii]
MQVYKGLEIVTNKIINTQKQGVKLCQIPTSQLKIFTQHVPIVVGGSNFYIEIPVEDSVFMFKYKYDTCFIWIDVEQSVLNRRVDIRVDQMVNAGLVDEVRQIFILDEDYTKGI